MAGSFAGHLAASLGATVQKVQAGAARKSEAWLDDGKELIPCEPSDLAAVATAAARGVDAVIWDDIYGRLGGMPAEFRDSVPYTLELFGSRAFAGPWSDATLMAEAGISYLTGNRDGPPVPLPGHPAAMLVGSHGFGALASAIANGAAPGPAAHTQMAAVELLAGFHQFGLIDYLCNGRSRRRNGRRWSNTHPVGVPVPCLDGHVALCPATPEQFFGLCLLLERPEIAEDPRFLSPTVRLENADALDEIMEAFFASRTRDELFAAGNELGVPISPLRNPDEVLADSSLEARGFWRERNGIKVPSSDVTTLPTGSAVDPVSGPKSLPLEGLRVVELTKVWAGPLLGRALADLGAEVVKVESPWARGPAVVTPEISSTAVVFPGDEPGERPWNRMGILNILNRSKKSIAVDIKDPQGGRIVRELCRQADIVVENNRPGALDRSDLGYEAISAENPGVVFVGISGYGAESPFRDYPAYGPVTEAMAGLTWWIRDGEHPEVALQTGWGIPDPVVAAMAVARVGAALNARRATGKGQFIDLSQVESCVTFQGDLFVEWQEADVAERTWRMGTDSGTSAKADGEGSFIVQTRLGLDGDAAVRSGPPRSALTVERLRELGVAAARDNSPAGVLNSAELWDFWIEFDHPDTGALRYDGNPVLNADGRLPAAVFPSLGEDNRQILVSWLGYSEGDCEALENDGTLVSVPRLPGEA